MNNSPSHPVPKTWQTVRLEEIAHDFVSGGTPSTVHEEYWSGDIPWMRSAHITGKEIFTGEKQITQKGLDESASNVVPRDNLLIATRVSLGNTAINRIDIAISQDLTGIILDKNKANENYVYYALVNKENQILSISQGTTIKGILREDLKRIKISLPPLVEQRGIAEILGTVDEAIQRTDAVISKAEELKRGLMQRLFTRGIGHTKFKPSELGEIPETWEIESLENCLSLCDYGLSIPFSEQGKYPIIRMNNIEDGLIVENDLRYIDLTEKEFENHRLRKGDILFNRTNSHELVGKVGIYLYDGNHTFASYLIRLRVNEKLKDLFLNYFLNLPITQSKLKALATRGVSQSNINATNLKKVIVPIPPVSEQERVIEQILSIDQKIRTEKVQKHLSEELKKGLMQVLLSGKVRVRLDECGLHKIQLSRE